MITDPALPHLSQALDPAQATRWYGEQAVDRAARRNTTYTPGARCLAAHELTGAGVRVFVTAEATPSGLAYSLATEDPALPALGDLTDDAALSERFGQRCSATLVRYEPRTRAVVRVETAARPLIAMCIAGGPPPPVPDLPQLAVPLAWWADWSTLIQPVIDGRQLHDLLGSAEQAGALAAAGRCAAVVHATPATIVDAPIKTFADDLAELDGYHAPIAQADPGLAGRYGTLVDALYGLGPVEGLAPGHGALRTDAFLLLRETGEPVLIGLDGLCRAEPSRDVGNLLADLDWRGIRRSGDAEGLRAAADAFLAGYAEVRPPPDPRRLSASRAASLLKITGRLYRSLACNEWPLVPDLLDRAASTTDAVQGERAVRLEEYLRTLR